MKIQTIAISSLLLLSTCVYPLLGQSRQANTNGITIAYESFGSTERETILLIAGTNAQLTMWPVKFCHELANRGYKVIRFDNRDIGLSTRFDKVGGLVI